LSSRSPYILLAFANPLQVPEEYLAALLRESSLVRGYLEPLDLDDVCDLTHIPEATIEQIFDRIEGWQRRKDLVLFHYGGHASASGLLLNTAEAGSQKAHAEGLARLLGSLPELKLVFLNGCSTKGQVYMLLKQGVKAVIATSTKVQDRKAVDFADRFYKNLTEGKSIGESFERAKNFLLSKYKHQVLTPDESRSMFWDEEETEELPWGLYHREDVESVLNWCLPTEPARKRRFGELDKYTCNRADQNSIFKTRFLTNRGVKKVQTYFIHGEEKQSPKGLFNRFVLEHISMSYEQTFHKVALMEEASELLGAKVNLLTALFDAVELTHAGMNLSELKLSAIAKAPSVRHADCIVIKFKVYSSAWKPFTGDFIRWFLTEFIDEAALPPKSPDFIFFFSVIYEESSEGGFIKRLFKSSPKDKILKTMQQFSEISILKELPPVKRGDIHKWFDRIEVDDVLEKEAQMEKFFPNQEIWEMVRVERKLEQIIELYNDKHV